MNEVEILLRNILIPKAASLYEELAKELRIQAVLLEQTSELLRSAPSTEKAVQLIHDVQKLFRKNR